MSGSDRQSMKRSNEMKSELPRERSSHISRSEGGVDGDIGLTSSLGENHSESRSEKEESCREKNEKINGGRRRRIGA